MVVFTVIYVCLMQAFQMWLWCVVAADGVGSLLPHFVACERRTNYAGMRARFELEGISDTQDSIAANKKTVHVRCACIVCVHVALHLVSTINYR